jgi:hypothetical protein
MVKPYVARHGTRHARTSSLIGTFTQNGMVDEQTQRNDIEVIRQILKTPETIPIQQAYDFRFAREADRQLTQSGWRLFTFSF